MDRPHTDPITLFHAWYDEEQRMTDVRIPSACCLSTVGADGYPNARFVSLKAVEGGRFIVTGPLDSRKGDEIARVPRAALTFWWTGTERQVRVQGDVTRIDSADADRHFSDRDRELQILSNASRQGAPFEDTQALTRAIDEFGKRYDGRPVPRPVGWGGIAVHPIRIEFFQFRPDRFHERRLFIRHAAEWSVQLLQP